MTMATTSLPTLLLRRVATISSCRSRLLKQPSSRAVSSRPYKSVSCISRHHLSVSEHHPVVVVVVPRSDNFIINNNNSFRSTRHSTLPSSSSTCFQTRSINVTVTHASNTGSDEKSDSERSSSAASSSSSSPIAHHDDETNGIIHITASCASRIKQLASTRPNPDSIYLRLFVDAGGCSGFQYKFLLLSSDDRRRPTKSNADSDYYSRTDGSGGNDNQDHDNRKEEEEEEEEDGTIDPEEDIIFVKDGVRVVIDSTSLELLRGSTIDYVSEMIRSSFAVVNNPQSESACGCGSSFAAKNFGMNPALD